MPTDTPPAGLASQFRHFFRGLCDVVADHIEQDAGAACLIVAIINRLLRRQNRLVALLARFEAGTLRPSCREGEPRAHSDRAARAPDPVPRCRAYLVRLLKHEAVVYGRILGILLADPEMAALLAASPQAGRLLRPLWRMLSLRPLPTVLLPPSRDVSSSSRRPARALPAPLPESRPASSPGVRVSRDPVRAARRSGFRTPIPA